MHTTYVMKVLLMRGEEGRERRAEGQINRWSRGVAREGKGEGEKRGGGGGGEREGGRGRGRGREE